eukprot:GHVT01079464.1.p2 GENE.GHVT01079464.1~~GHVT01079464.1.p2  ORF type:complete len:105 (+),score=0.20 GHVT01079464.1:2238-2552(+)
MNEWSLVGSQLHSSCSDCITQSPRQPGLATAFHAVSLRYTPCPRQRTPKFLFMEKDWHSTQSVAPSFSTLTQVLAAFEWHALPTFVSSYLAQYDGLRMISFDFL